MVKSTENGSAVPPFLLKCYEMVDDQSTDTLISWGKTGDSFVIRNLTQFQSELLPRHFKHKNFSSFVRQLNIYGFRKIDTDQWEFANDGFIKGQKHLLKNICRRKQSQSHNQHKSSQEKSMGAGVCEEDKNLELWKEIQSLNTDKNALTQELILLSQHQQISQNKLLVLREQLKGMEKNQQQMLSFIVMAMQNPGFFVQLLQPKENNWRMAETGKNILKRVTDDHEMVSSDGMIVRYQMPTDESAESLSTSILDPENSLELDLSSDEVKDLFMNIDFTSLPLDEKFFSMDNHFHPNLPDDDSMLEQLLLSSSLADNNEDIEGNNEELTNSKMEKESTLFGSQLQESSKSGLLMEGSEKSGSHPDKNNRIDTSTGKMELLFSECSL